MHARSWLLVQYKSIKMPLPARPTIPIPTWLSNLYSVFPLITYPSPPTTVTPSSPTLWLVGPPPSGSTLSLDPACRIAQTLARFTQTAVEVEWWDSQAGGVGARLPNLHLADGSLLSHEDLAEYFLQAGAPKAKEKGTPSPVDPIYQAFQSLLRSALLPAALVAVYLASDAPSTVPAKELPLLSGWAQRAIDWSDRREVVKEIVKLRGGKAGGLDTVEVEREAKKAVDAFEEKMAETGPDGWFDGAKAPTELDAELFGLLSVLLELPHAEKNPLRLHLLKSRTLLRWLKLHGFTS